MTLAWQLLGFAVAVFVVGVVAWRVVVAVYAAQVRARYVPTTAGTVYHRSGSTPLILVKPVLYLEPAQAEPPDERRNVPLNTPHGQRMLPLMTDVEAHELAWRRCYRDFLLAGRAIGSWNQREMCEANLLGRAQWDVIAGALTQAGILVSRRGQGTAPMMSYQQALEDVKTHALPCPAGPVPRVAQVRSATSAAQTQQ